MWLCIKKIYNLDLILVVIEIENFPSFCNTKSTGRFMADLIRLPQGKREMLSGQTEGKER